MLVRLSLAAVLVASLTACVDFYGARKVTYSETEFYLRHYPMWIGSEGAQAIAEAECQELGKSAREEGSEQYYWFDVRYVGFTCI